MPFMCSICGEEAVRICARCTKDVCGNHLCEKCLRCSDCCECDLALSEPVPNAPPASARTVFRAVTGAATPDPELGPESELEAEPEPGPSPEPGPEPHPLPIDEPGPGPGSES
jgi:hypothetical protein